MSDDLRRHAETLAKQADELQRRADAGGMSLREWELYVEILRTMQEIQAELFQQPEVEA